MAAGASAVGRSQPPIWSHSPRRSAHTAWAKSERRQADSAGAMPPSRATGVYLQLAKTSREEGGLSPGNSSPLRK